MAPEHESRDVPETNGNVVPNERGKHTKRFIALVPVLVLAAAAMAQEVSFDFENDANFSAFETYAWINIGDNGQQLDELTANHLRSAVDAELAMKGLHKADIAQADLFIGYQTAIRSEREIAVYSAGWEYGPGWRAGGVGTAHTSTIPVGTIVLDMYVRLQKLLVWRGSVSKTIDVNANPGKREKAIHKGIHKLLNNYPPLN